MMARQVQQMTRLIDDLMDLSRISRGKTRLQFETMDLRDAVRNAVETSRPLIEQQRHELDVHLPDQPLIVLGDSARLAQVFSNLINNAAKYTEKQGGLRSRSRVRTIRRISACKIMAWAFRTSNLTGSSICLPRLIDHLNVRKVA